MGKWKKARKEGKYAQKKIGKHKKKVGRTEGRKKGRKDEKG